VRLQVNLLSETISGACDDDKDRAEAERITTNAGVIRSINNKGEQQWQISSCFPNGGGP
jgi:hypothetical protein